MWHILNVIFWQNYGVGNFTASGLSFAGGYAIGRRHYHRHIKPVLDKIHEIHGTVVQQEK